MNRFSNRILLTSSITILVPILFILVRLLLDIEPLSLPLLTWLLIEAILQISVFLGYRLGWLNLHQFKTTIFVIWFIIGLPATILCTYSGILPEFRLAPYLILFIAENELSKAIYTILLLFMGILAFLPFYQGSIQLLVIDFFRPFVIAVFIFGSSFLLKDNSSE